MATLQEQKDAAYAALCARASAACSPVDIPAPEPTPDGLTELQRAQQTLTNGITRPNSAVMGGQSIPNLEKLR